MSLDCEQPRVFYPCPPAPQRPTMSAFIPNIIIIVAISTLTSTTGAMSRTYQLGNGNSVSRIPFASMAEVRIQPLSILKAIRFAHRVQAKSCEDDWTGTTDAEARRKAQTRLNTRAYRKRKALAKKAEQSSAGSETLIKLEPLVECWDNEQQSVFMVPESHAKHLYNASKPLLPHTSSKEHFQFVFPLCPDHLITLLQFNATRAIAANRTLISGILVTPLDCGTGEEVIHVIPYPSKPEALPLALLPTTLQQTVLHGEWIDFFPCPDARDRLIQAAGTFDEDELFADCSGGLYEGFSDDEVKRRGLIAWSPPWDISGWEMSEGFVRKWGWLFKGLSDPLEATNFWRRERGEGPLAYDCLPPATA